MDTLQNMRVFVRVVESGSFTAAAQHFEATTSTVSRAASDPSTTSKTRAEVYQELVKAQRDGQLANLNSTIYAHQ
jgi:Bacterial regulatory helix-turn-helix protein, lysR family